MATYIVEFGVSVKSVTVEASSIETARVAAWDAYDDARDQDSDYPEITIKSVVKQK